MTLQGIPYQKNKDGIEILKIPEAEGEVSISEAIEEEFVRWAAPYAFSGTQVEEVALPRYMEKIGNYIFYRCFRLRKLSCSDALVDVGAGAFTGSSIREIEIDFYSGEKSALKFIVDEIRFELEVTMRFHREDESVETARVVFPEHYEEAVENTPARIVETHYHGSGGNYRQCFYQRELNFAEYDGLLPRAVAEEKEEVVVKIAALRLLCPYKLSAAAKERYEAYLAAHMECAGKVYVQKEDVAMLRFFGRAGLWSEPALGCAVDAAEAGGKTEVLGLLMDERRRLFPKKKKVFEL